MGNQIVVLHNENLRLTVSTRGAEMQSLITHADGKEQLWQGDQTIWADRAPWLFPLIGQLRHGQYRYRGQSYRMPMHGFASGAEFELMDHTESTATLRLAANAETLLVYPWRFLLEISYALEKNSVKITCAVRCADQEDMYFSFGAHPGFLCAQGDMLCFEGVDALECQRLCLETHLLRPETVRMDAVIRLEESLFDDDAMLFHKPSCQGATLKRADDSGVRFDFGNVPWVGVWSRKRKGLPYVCIEPWHGVDDPVDAEGDIETKRDIVHLPAGEVFNMAMSITPFVG